MERVKRQRLRGYMLLMRMDRPIGTMLLLWPTLWALWIAGEGRPDWWVAVVFVVGVFLMRSAGCVINDYADREFDPFVERTRNRPLAVGMVSPKEALLLFVVLSAMAFALVLTLNTLTIMLSFVGAALAASYPFMKRLTYLPQVYLGLAFGWSVPMAFAAQTDAVPIVAWLMLIVTVLWATAYDTIYAMVDRSDDLKIGVKSTAILFGEADRAIIGIIQVMMVAVLVIIGQQMKLGGIYFLAVVAAGGFMAYQQYLIKDRDGMQCMRAFRNNNWVGALIFLGLFGQYL